MTSLPSSNNLQIVTTIGVLDDHGNITAYLTDILPGASVTIDATAENIRSCSFSCADPAGVLTPVWNPSGGLLAPTGVEVKIFAGYIVDGAVTLFSQGVFRLTEVDVVTSISAPGPILNCTGVDRSARIAVNLFADAYSIPNGTPVEQAVLDILSQQAPWVTQTNIVNSPATVAAQQYQPGDDPFQAIQQLCASAGLLVYFDRDGIFTVIVDPSQNPKPPSALFLDGPSNTASAITRINNSSPGYNGVIVVGQSLTNSTVPVVGVAWDTNPKSPTFAYGPYGKVPAPPVQVSSVSDSASALAMAQALLPQVLGQTNQVAVTTVPLFWLDVYDLIVVKNEATQTDSVLILEQATIPLDYSQVAQITGVPLGTDISQYDGLSNTPSVAAYAPTSTTAITYNPATGGYSVGSSSGGGTSGVGAGLGAGAFGLGAFYPNGGLFRRVLRYGNSGYTVKRDVDGVESLTPEISEELP